ncbi:MAG TPA: helix-turn-helix transcriptional regulator [Thermodesulfobacteriota bacterium]|nr:helix-turn-helix transcriptional regulator [Thermodesulfobacteriota bacterium]
MKYTTEELAAELRKARKKAGLTQKELGEKTGIPQSHISRIEKGEVDIQASSLVGIARVLGLELMLVPRELAAAVDGLMRGLAKDLAGPPRMYLPDGGEEEGNIDI